MKLEQSFEVKAPIDEVWTALNDLERVAPCLPGAAITGKDDDGTYHGEFKVKLGPTTAAYKGTIRIESADESTHTATLAAKGSDKRGQGGANATIVNSLVSVDGGTRVDAVTDFSITGRLARFGRGGMIQDISNRLLRDFAACLATRLGEPAAAAEASVAAAGAAAPSGTAAMAPDDAPPPATGLPDATGGASAGTPSSPDVTGGASAGTPSSPDLTGGASAGTPSSPDATAPASSGPPPATAAAGGPARTYEPPPPSEPLKAGSLFWSVLWERIKRLFGGGRK